MNIQAKRAVGFGIAHFLVLTVCFLVAFPLSMERFDKGGANESAQVSRYLVKDFGTSKSRKSTRKRDDLLCPSRPASVPLRHTIASSALASQHSLKWLNGVLYAYAASPLALAHDGYATSGHAYWGLPAFASLSMAGSDRNVVSGQVISIMMGSVWVARS